jgi:uncharacterized membrane protein YidH (DUF202 family)
VKLALKILVAGVAIVLFVAAFFGIAFGAAEVSQASNQIMGFLFAMLCGGLWFGAILHLVIRSLAK